MGSVNAEVFFIGGQLPPLPEWRACPEVDNLKSVILAISEGYTIPPLHPTQQVRRWTIKISPGMYLFCANRFMCQYILSPPLVFYPILYHTIKTIYTVRDGMTQNWGQAKNS